MAGRAQDVAKRKLLRIALLSDEYKRASDRDVAKDFDCSKGLVGAVRREMIATGEIEPPESSRRFAPEEQYQPGQSARGGYVYDERGQVIRDTEWKRRLAKAAKRLNPPARKAAGA